MPEYNIRDTILTSLNAQEPWPENVKLFQPYEVEQILLPDNASCLAVQAFLKMCNLPFEVEMRWNAEFMSPSGRVPFIKCGAFVVSELEPIVQFACNKGVSLCNKMSTEEKAEMRAYMSLITNVLVNAELYVSWLDGDTFNSVTKVRNSSVYPWPLGWIQTRNKRNQVAKRLKALHWYDKTLDQVLADVEQCCNSLSQRLGDKDYFFGSFASPLDALVYGHMRALLSAMGPRAPLMIKPITSALLKHTVRMTALTQMKLTSQEEYLLTQAFTVATCGYYSTDRYGNERSNRTKKSKLSILNPIHDKIPIEDKHAFGKELCFKPFASKKMIIVTSKEGLMTCEYEKFPSINDFEKYKFMRIVVDQLFDKVDDIIAKECDHERDFELLVYPAQIIENTNSFENPNTFESPNAYENANTCQSPDIYEHLNEKSYESSNAYKNPNAYECPNEFEQPNTYECPNEFEHPNTYECPNEFEHPNTYENPNELENPNAYECPDEFEEPNACESSNTFEKVYNVFENKRLDTIAEMTDRTVSLESGKDIGNAYNSAGNMMDSDGVVNDKHLFIVNDTETNDNSDDEYEDLEKKESEREISLNQELSDISSKNIENTSNTSKDSRSALSLAQRSSTRLSSGTYSR